jgi:hypothetical protein
MPSKPRAPEAESKDGKQSMKWWQWFIVYPTIATSFFAAIPTATNYAKSLALGVKPSQVSDAETQNKLWEKNADCLINAKGLSIKTPQAFEVAATVCPNGDILLAGKRADSDSQRRRWVPISDVVPPLGNTTASNVPPFSLISSATAGERRTTIVAQAEQVICQHWVGQGMLLQRVATPNGCFDQVVNTFNGVVVSRQNAPCTPQC